MRPSRALKLGVDIMRITGIIKIIRDHIMGIIGMAGS
jgi:hypothetical protein